MPYLFTLPGLLCGLALSIEDVRHRRVPIAWVAAGLLPVVVWWLAMGVAGITWIALWTRFGPQRTSPAHAGKVPYVPVILAGAIVAVVVGA